MARPVEWTPEKKTEAQNYICQQVALGRSLVSICKEPDTPAYSTVMEWRAEDEGFAEKYARAREDQADFLAEEIIDIADMATDANLSRLQIDARKWKAGKLKPKVYGDRLNLDGDLKVAIPDEQLDARLAHLIGKAGIAGLIGGEGAPEAETEAPDALSRLRSSTA